MRHADTATGNTPPSVSTAAGYTIPARTPFALTASGSDANGDTLTYLWDQFNLGASNPTAGVLVDNGSSPIFRNYNPTTSYTRTFPALASILSGANGSTWELLPTTTRTLNFKVTARDNRAAGGGTQQLDECELGEGAVLCPFVILSSNVKIGKHFHANMKSYVAHDCVVGDYVTLAPNVMCNGNVVLEDHAYIGAGALLKQGKPGQPLIIGKGAIVGMDAVVTKNVPPGVTVIGNPAKAMIK